MIKICIMHYTLNNMKFVIDFFRNYQTYENLNIILILAQQYELEYFIRHRDIDIVIVEADCISNNYDSVYLSNRIKILNHKTLVIFYSENIDNNLLLRIINSEPFAYVEINNLKNDLSKALNRAISIITKRSTIYTYFKSSEKFFVELNSIIYFMSSHRTIQFICIDDKMDEFYKKMNDIEYEISKLSNHFVRINQSYLININYIVSFTNSKVIMVNGEIIGISRKYHHNLELLKIIDKDYNS